MILWVEMTNLLQFLKSFQFNLFNFNFNFHCCVLATGTVERGRFENPSSNSSTCFDILTVLSMATLCTRICLGCCVSQMVHTHIQL